MSERKLVSLTNIPTPYRVHFYTALQQALQNRDISSSVIFMAITEPGRHWTLDPAEMKFDCEVAPGLHPVVGNRVLHLNPAVLSSLYFQPPDWLLVSGSWFFPTVQLAAAIGKRKRTKMLFWSESNLAYIEHRSRFTKSWRANSMNRFDAFVTPGQWARDYVLEQVPSAREKPFLMLPNVVDEKLYRDKVTHLRENRPALRKKWALDLEDRPVLFTAARLEPIKGIKELVTAVCSSPDFLPMTIVIAGEGSLKSELQDFVQNSAYAERIRFTGFVEEEAILELLALADGLILPSLGDPYPLAVIEAMFARLPLLLSDRVGCHPEALISGENGFLFDPSDPGSICNCLKAFLAGGPEQWEAMGAASLSLAESRFTTENVISSFVDEVISL